MFESTLLSAIIPTTTSAGQRIVVTGGAGFIGSHLVEALDRAGVGEIIVVDNLSRGSLSNLAGVSARVRFVEGDVRSLDTLRDLFQDATIVYHLAAQSNVLGAEEDGQYAFSTNVVGTFNVLDAARDSGVTRVVFTSSREVYGDQDRMPVVESTPTNPKNAYGISKAVGEEYCRLYRLRGLDSVVLRFANVYGPRDHGRVIPRFIDQALRNQTITLFGGTQVVDFVWIGEVVRVLRNAGVSAPIAEPVNIGSGRGVTIADLAERVRATVGSTAPVVRLPSRDVEVTRFVADTARAQHLFQLDSPSDPLGHLGDVVAWSRQRARTTHAVEIAESIALSASRR